MDKGSKLLIQLNRMRVAWGTLVIYLPIMALCLSLPIYLMIGSVAGILHVLSQPDYIIAEGVTIPRGGATPIINIVFLWVQGILALSINAVGAVGIIILPIVLLAKQLIQGIRRKYTPFLVFDEHGIVWNSNEEMFFPWDCVEKVDVVNLTFVRAVRVLIKDRDLPIYVRILSRNWPEFWLQENNGREVRLTQSEFEHSLDKLNVRKHYDGKFHD